MGGPCTPLKLSDESKLFGFRKLRSIETSFDSLSEISLAAPCEGSTDLSHKYSRNIIIVLSYLVPSFYVTLPTANKHARCHIPITSQSTPIAQLESTPHSAPPPPPFPSPAFHALIFASSSVSGLSMSFVSGYRAWLKRIDKGHRVKRRDVATQ